MCERVVATTLQLCGKIVYGAAWQIRDSKKVNQISLSTLWRQVIIAKVILSRTASLLSDSALRASRLIYMIFVSKDKNFAINLYCEMIPAEWNDALSLSIRYRCHFSTTFHYNHLLRAHIDIAETRSNYCVVCVYFFMWFIFFIYRRWLVHGQWCGMRCSAPNRFIWFFVCNFSLDVLLPQRIKINNAGM